MLFFNDSLCPVLCIMLLTMLLTHILWPSVHDSWSQGHMTTSSDLDSFGFSALFEMKTLSSHSCFNTSETVARTSFTFLCKFRQGRASFFYAFHGICLPKTPLKSQQKLCMRLCPQIPRQLYTTRSEKLVSEMVDFHHCIPHEVSTTAGLCGILITGSK